MTPLLEPRSIVVRFRAGGTGHERERVLRAAGHGFISGSVFSGITATAN